MSTLKERNALRLRRSIAGEPSDGHAVFHFYTYPFFHGHTGVPLDDYFHKRGAALEAQRQVFEQLDRCGNFAPDVGAAAECSGLGGRVRFDSHGFISVVQAPVNDIAELLDTPPGDPFGGNYMRVALEQLEDMVRGCPEGYSVNPPCVQGPVTIAAQLRGITEFCMDCIDCPDKVERLLEIVCETLVSYIRAIIKVLGKMPHHLLMGDDLSALLSPGQYEALVLPAYARVFAAFPGLERWLHNDAYAAHIARFVPRAGFTAWQYGPGVEPEHALEQTKGTVSLIGGLDPVALAGYTEEQTAEECRKMFRRFGGNNRFVLSAGGSVNQVPLKNLSAMFRAAEEFSL